MYDLLGNLKRNPMMDISSEGGSCSGGGRGYNDPYSPTARIYGEEDQVAIKYQKQNNITFTAEELRIFKLGYRAGCQMEAFYRHRGKILI